MPALREFAPGEYFSWMHATFEGSKPESSICYGRVVKQNRATTWVRTEHGDHKRVDNGMIMTRVEEGHWHPEIPMPAEPPKSSPIVKVTRNHMLIRFTHEQARQLFSVVGAANQDGDHRDWLKSAGGTPAQLRALGEVMEIAKEMHLATK